MQKSWSEGAHGLLLPVRLWIGKKLFKTLGQFVVRVSPGTIIKGPCDLAELEALEYVARHTSIPVPKVLRSHRHNERIYIEMEYVRGIDLQAALQRGRISEEQKKAILAELVGYVKQLRRLQPPQEGAVGSANLKECLDYRIGPAPFGPFEDHMSFHSFLRRRIPLEDCTKVFGEEVTRCHSRQYRSYFTHADLCPRNIVVDGGKIAAVIDWQFGGWYPEYWEYTKAYFGLYDMPGWWEEFKLAVTRYDDELAAERALWRQCDQPGVPFIL
jgi:aminoglycoside phosphotransferase (APT) family kinase protein